MDWLLNLASRAILAVESWPPGMLWLVVVALTFAVLAAIVLCRRAWGRSDSLDDTASRRRMLLDEMREREWLTDEDHREVADRR